jgi:hypothetical protein
VRSIDEIRWYPTLQLVCPQIVSDVSRESKKHVSLGKPTIAFHVQKIEPPWHV